MCGVRAGRRARACGWLELGCGEAFLRRLLNGTGWRRRVGL